MPSEAHFCAKRFAAHVVGFVACLLLDGALGQLFEHVVFEPRTPRRTVVPMPRDERRGIMVIHQLLPVIHYFAQRVVYNLTQRLARRGGNIVQLELACIQGPARAHKIIFQRGLAENSRLEGWNVRTLERCRLNIEY